MLKKFQPAYYTTHIGGWVAGTYGAAGLAREQKKSDQARTGGGWSCERGSKKSRKKKEGFNRAGLAESFFSGII